MSRKKVFFLLLSVFIISVCALSYELLSATVSTYLLGDSVFYFSLVIGIFLSAMGIGSFFSRYVEKSLLSVFIQIELIIALTGGLMPAILFYSFSNGLPYSLILLILTSTIGAFIGMEVPLIIRIFKDFFSLKDNVSTVLTLDYVGALFGSILFPVFFIPTLGILESGFFFGILNSVVALITIYIFKDKINKNIFLSFQSVFLIVFYIIMMLLAGRLLKNIESDLFDDQLVIFSTNTPYQRIVLTQDRDNFSLYLNGNLQFSTRDEYRYHEALVIPAMSYLNTNGDILVLGGGDGLAIRQLLKFDVSSITLVDIDKKMTELFKNHPLLSGFNKQSFKNKKVSVINEDAFKFLQNIKKIRFNNRRFSRSD